MVNEKVNIHEFSKNFLKKFKKNFKKQLHELSEYYIIFSSLKKRTRNEGL